MVKLEHNPDVASVILRIGLAAVFVYAAVDSFREPDAWISFLPSFSTHILAAKTMLDLIAIFQLVLSAWLLTGRYLKYAALVAALLFAGIMVTNPHTFLITFRDMGLLAAALALVFLDK